MLFDIIYFIGMLMGELELDSQQLEMGLMVVRFVDLFELGERSKVGLYYPIQMEINHFLRIRLKMKQVAERN